jgi:hypothetical protein
VRVLTASLLGAVAAAALAGPAAAERPGWFSTPSISGQPRVGATILGSPGGVKCDPACVGLVHEWTSCVGGGPAGADRPTGGLPFDGRPAPGCVVRARGELNYAVRREDAGRYIQLHVIATNYDCGNIRFSDGSQECRYSSGHAYSATIGPVGSSAVAQDGTAPGAVVARSTAAPAVRGLARVGETLTASPGAWTGTRPIRFSYQWLRCATALGGCPPVPGATAATYAVGPRDVGTRISVIVVATNRAGATWAAAPESPTVVAAGARPANVRDVRELARGERLVITSIAAPRAVRRVGTVVVRVRITDARGVRVRGAVVDVFGPRGEVPRVAARTGASGDAVLRVRLRAAARRRTLALTVRASKFRGDPVAAVRRISLAVRP